MADYPWYEEVQAAASLMQGDIIEDCPVLTFRDGPWNPPAGSTLVDALTAAGGYTQARVVVMTQACDLAQSKVRDVVLCKLESLNVWRASWESARRAKGQEPSAKAWRAAVEELRQGKVWSSALLDGYGGTAGTTQMQHQVVSFASVYSLPLTFLQSWVVAAGGVRTRLLPPYREHLSQAFARFFMRVGLPHDLVLP